MKLKKMEDSGSKIQNVDLRSEEVQDILSKVPHWMVQWGSFLFLILILLIFLISWILKYPDILTAQGYITTDIPPQKIKALLPGKIDTLLVTQDQVVRPGQNLGVLENSADYNDVYFLKTILDTTEFKNGNLIFPVESLPFLFLGEIEKAYADFESNYWKYKLEKDLNPFENQILASKISYKESKDRLAVLFEQQRMAEKKLEFQRKNLSRVLQLFEKGVISEQEQEEKQQEFLSVNQTYKNLSKEISQTEEAIAMAENGLKSTNIERVQTQKQFLKAVLQSFSQLRIALEDWEKKYVFSTDIRGRVAFMDNLVENKNINQSDAVFTIIPTESSNLVAKLQVSPEKSGKILTGQKVNLSLNNYPEAEYGVVHGKVNSISLITNGQGFYLVEVILPNELITNYGKKINFKPEMQVTASIITEDLRLIERFFYQLREIFRR